MKFFSSFLLFLLLMGGFPAKSQDSKVVIDPTDPAFRKKYENVDFKGSFSVQVLNDNTNNYFLADFSVLKERFDKIYFLSLVFQNSKVVNIDHEIDQPKIWFLADKQYPVNVINTELKQMKDEAMQKSASWSAGQKTDWLKQNDKYK